MNNIISRKDGMKTVTILVTTRAMKKKKKLMIKKAKLTMMKEKKMMMSLAKKDDDCKEEEKNYLDNHFYNLYILNETVLKLIHKHHFLWSLLEMFHL